MVVVLANCQLSAVVRAHPLARDKRKTPVPSTDDEVETRGPFPGSALEQADGTWKLRLDMRCGPLRQGDKATDGTRTWVANADPIAHQVPGAPDVDYISMVATLDPPRAR